MAAIVLHLLHVVDGYGASSTVLPLTALLFINFMRNTRNNELTAEQVDGTAYAVNRIQSALTGARCDSARSYTPFAPRNIPLLLGLELAGGRPGSSRPRRPFRSETCRSRTQSASRYQTTASVASVAGANSRFRKPRLAGKGVRRAKAAFFQWVKAPPGEMLPPEATGAVMEVTKWLKPSECGPHNLVAARVCRPLTRVNAE